jgi:hypothetical protein
MSHWGAFGPPFLTGFDVDRTLRIAAADVAVGRRARPHESRREGPESGGKPAYPSRVGNSPHPPER